MSQLIIFEGNEGSGKSTQSKILAEAIDAKHMFFPTKSGYGAKAREIMSKEILTNDDYAELVENMKNDFLLGSRVINKYINAGVPVVLDRYWFSALVLNARTLELYADMLSFGMDKLPRPDVMFYINTPIDECEKRIKSRKSDDTSKFEDAGEMKRNNREFLKVAYEYDFHIINGKQSEVDVSIEIFDKLLEEQF